MNCTCNTHYAPPVRYWLLDTSGTEAEGCTYQILHADSYDGIGRHGSLPPGTGEAGYTDNTPYGPYRPSFFHWPTRGIFEANTFNAIALKPIILYYFELELHRSSQISMKILVCVCGGERVTFGSESHRACFSSISSTVCRLSIFKKSACHAFSNGDSTTCYVIHIKLGIVCPRMIFRMQISLVFIWYWKVREINVMFLCSSRGIARGAFETIITAKWKLRKGEMVKSSTQCSVAFNFYT